MREITPFDLPDTHMEPDGYDMTSVPSLSQRNLEFLINEHNKLVKAVNLIIEFHKNEEWAKIFREQSND